MGIVFLSQREFDTLSEYKVHYAEILTMPGEISSLKLKRAKLPLSEVL